MALEFRLPDVGAVLAVIEADGAAANGGAVARAATGAAEAPPRAGLPLAAPTTRRLARDLGVALDIGGHLTALRRTRVGPYDLAMARTIEQLTEKLEVLPLPDAVAAAFPRRDVSADEAHKVAHGGRLAAVGLGPGPVGVFGPDGALLALVEEHGPVSKSLAVFVP